MKVDTNIHHMSGHCGQGFRGQRSEVKVMARLINDSVASRLTCLKEVILLC